MHEGDQLCVCVCVGGGDTKKQNNISSVSNRYSMGYTEIYWDILRYTEIYWDILRYTEIY